MSEELVGVLDEQAPTLEAVPPTSDRRVSLSIRFDDLRASGITWRHARGENPSLIRQDCGHEDRATNEIYIRALRGLAEEDLFPELPARLCGARQPKFGPSGPQSRQNRRYFVGAEGFEESTKGHETPQKSANGGQTAPGPEAVGCGSRMHADAALREAVKAAVDAGLYDRAGALLALLRAI